MRRPSRTAVALALTAAGLGVPCCAWYVAGSSAARERAAAILAQSPREANLEAGRLARQIALRLEALRESESRRSFQDYLSGDRLAEIVGGDCGTEDRLPSPLAEGPVDPMIRAHFQIDDVGLVTLPALGSGPRPAGATETDGIEQAVLGEIECASSTHLAALQRSVGGPSSRHLASPRGLVTVGPFSWHTVPIDGAASLVALREVSTPIAVLTQGFVVPTERLEALLDGSPFATTIRPGLPQGDGGASIPIQGDPWSVDVDFAGAQAAAAAEARAVRSRFHRSFSLGSLAALVAGASLVLLVRETERTGRERTRFAAAAAHELRTPLAGLQLYGEMLADGSGDPARREAYARRLADEAQRLGRVVSNVLGYSRLQREGLAVAVLRGDLEAAVRSSLDRARPVLDAEGVPIEVEVRPGLPQACFDPDALHQILLNLLDNAAKFNRQAVDRTVRVTLSEDGGDPTVEVLDRGQGLDASVRRRLFRPFTHHPDPGAPAGLGIGLAIVKALAGAQGAQVSFREPPGGGAAFAVRFRRAA
jgi:signal transduction histidine kinase